MKNHWAMLFLLVAALGIGCSSESGKTPPQNSAVGDATSDNNPTGDMSGGADANNRNNQPDDASAGEDAAPGDMGPLSDVMTADMSAGDTSNPSDMAATDMAADGGATDMSACGDGVCDAAAGETIVNCPQDCVDSNLPECADGVDNDNDGQTDFRPGPNMGDPECDGPTDDDESA